MTSSREVYRNAWIRVREDAVTQPDGSPGIYGVVEFRNLTLGIVALNASGEVVLVGQHRYPLDYYSWEIPEGGCPQGDSPLNAAKRELEEEVGLQANDWQQLMTMHLSNSVTDEFCVVFVARDLFAGQQQLEATEDIEVKKLPLLEAIEMVKRGEITDGISAAALLRVALDLK